MSWGVEKTAGGRGTASAGAFGWLDTRTGDDLKRYVESGLVACTKVPTTASVGGATTVVSGVRIGGSPFVTRDGRTDTTGQTENSSLRVNDIHVPQYKNIP